jgi:hypothetical protein
MSEEIKKSQGTTTWPPSPRMKKILHRVTNPNEDSRAGVRIW